MLVMYVSAVCRCDCGLHDWVELTDMSGDWTTRFTIDSAVGEAIVVALSQPPCLDPAVEELAQAPSAGREAQANSLTLRARDENLTAGLRFDGRDGSSVATVDPCRALLAACRMRLPILVDEADRGFFRQTPVPDAFAAAFDPPPSDHVARSADEDLRDGR